VHTLDIKDEVWNLELRVQGFRDQGVCHYLQNRRHFSKGRFRFFTVTRYFLLGLCDWTCISGRPMRGL